MSCVTSHTRPNLCVFVCVSGERRTQRSLFGIINRNFDIVHDVPECQVTRNRVVRTIPSKTTWRSDTSAPRPVGWVHLFHFTDIPSNAKRKIKIIIIFARNMNDTNGTSANAGDEEEKKKTRRFYGIFFFERRMPTPFDALTKAHSHIFISGFAGSVPSSLKA